MQSTPARLGLLLLVLGGLMSEALPHAWGKEDEPLWKRLIAGSTDGVLKSSIGEVTTAPSVIAKETPAVPGPLPAGSSIKTYRRSRAHVVLTSWRTPIRMSQFTWLVLGEDFPTPVAGDQSPVVSIQVRGGSIYYARHVQQPSVQISTTSGQVRPGGTEFSVSVDPGSRRTEVYMFEGSAELVNDRGRTNLPAGHFGTMIAGEPIRIRPLLQATNLVQWWIDYPGIIAPEELPLTTDERAAWRASLDAYRSGDLRAAAELLETATGPLGGQEAVSTGLRMYRATLLLANGQPAEARRSLADVPPDEPVRRALETLIQALTPPWTNGTTVGNFPSPENSATTASEAMAESYRRQAGHQLEAALAAARRATVAAPDFGFAWARRAELAFSRGYSQEAREASTRACVLSPRNAAAIAIDGYLRAATGRMREAQETFEAAIQCDGELADAWLGRGLCRIRQGDLTGGQADLETAAMLEPQRSLLRSYLAKALADGWDFARAERELSFAATLDPHDPTPPLYRALIRERENRINPGIEDLETSRSLVDNRRVYRSALLLDQDRAVRGANLARLYTDAGFTDVGQRTAAEAVGEDYGSASAHLFLANSYSAWRDPGLVSLRYETPALAEYLVGNLLGPVGVGPLSPVVSRNEYSALFERDGLGFASETQWASPGDWWESAAQHGRFGRFQYSLDATYQSVNGDQPNKDLELMTLSPQAKWQVSEQDVLLVQAIASQFRAGDVVPRYDPAQADPQVRIEEANRPLVLGGWGHTWQPGVRTLGLIAGWESTYHESNPNHQSLAVEPYSDGTLQFLDPEPTPLSFDRRFTGGSAELQQIWQPRSHTVIAGLRYQAGAFADTADLSAGTTGIPISSVDPPMNRISGYLYDQWQIVRPLTLTLGVTYDQLRAPRNPGIAPLDGETDESELWSPKLGLVWQTWRGGRLRGAWSQSLGGASFDQSLRLEPTQIAGFLQSYRSLIPEPLLGTFPGQKMTLGAIAFEQDLATRTWLHAEVSRSTAEGARDVGALLEAASTDPIALRETADFEQRRLNLSAHQLIGEYFALGAGYTWTESTITDVFPGVVDTPAAPARAEARTRLAQLELSVAFNHPSGLFAQWQSAWNRQTNTDGNPDYPGDEFWHHNLWLGWRFLQRRAELAVGLLNLTDQDYRIYPLNWYVEDYRSRTVALRLRLAF